MCEKEGRGALGTHLLAFCAGLPALSEERGEAVEMGGNVKHRARKSETQAESRIVSKQGLFLGESGHFLRKNGGILG
ncbi:MAG TPA: hypothetical protein VMT91_11345, partial [Anaerolineales bacterium]|nr:hypothetical protein [Anaerolineales bacterium]